jgi:ribosome-binding protein aMBF1 (putative translation factor)
LIIITGNAYARTKEADCFMETQESSVIDEIATGNKIKKLITESGLSIRQISEKMMFTTPTLVYKWIKGKSMPTIDNIVVLAFIFDVKVDDIIVTKK